MKCRKKCWRRKWRKSVKFIKKPFRPLIKCKEENDGFLKTKQIFVGISSLSVFLLDKNLRWLEKWSTRHLHLRNWSNDSAAHLLVIRKSNYAVLDFLIGRFVSAHEADVQLGKKRKKIGLFNHGYGSNWPTCVICSMKEFEAETPSPELQELRNMGVSRVVSAFSYCQNEIFEMRRSFFLRGF